MMVMSDISDVFCPVKRGYFERPQDCRSVAREPLAHSIVDPKQNYGAGYTGSDPIPFWRLE